MQKAGLQERVAAPAASLRLRGQGLANRNTAPLQALLNEHPQATQLAALTAQLHAGAAMAGQRKLAAQAVPEGGLPQPLKSGIETLSGIAMDSVKVHYNSAQPAQLNAHAFAQGSEIHLGPGQEGHLPHEAWHVAQQAQGRVAPTLQMAGRMVNDDARLEEEADAMGAAALQRKAAPAHGRALRTDTGTAAPVQRKVNFSGFRDHHYLPEIFEKIRAAFEQNKARLQSLMPKEFAEIEAKIASETELIVLIVKLNVSAIDYGEINLDNPQHAIQLFLDFKKYLRPAYGTQPSEQAQEREEDESSAEDAALDKQLAWQGAKAKKLQALAEGERSGTSSSSLGLESKGEEAEKPHVYDTALLGAGASIAYYLNANGRSLNGQDTVLIGNPQPWQTWGPGSRGIDYINHPMHMISPLRVKSGISDPETFDGNAQTLSDQIREVIGRYIPFGNRVTATVSHVSRGRDGWYKIESSAGDYYARKVISGFGIGPHQKPRNSEKGQDALDPGKVMDMDSYHRDLKNPYSAINRRIEREGADNVRIGISGPNAGVDAVKSATDRGMHVDWYVSGGPAIVEGMANAIARKELVTIYYCYLGGWTHAGEKLILVAGKVNDRPTIRRDFANGGTAKATVDFLIYAPGPDVSKVSEVFSPEIRADLSPHVDAETDGNKHFDAGAVYNWQRSDVPESALNIDSSIADCIRDVGRRKALRSSYSNIFGALLRQTHEILGAYTFALPPTPTSKPVQGSNVPKPVAPPALALSTADRTLEIIGGQAHRQRVAAEAERARGGSEPVDRRLVAETLPPTVIIDDQLTPIRSQMEALGNYIPAYIGTEESNFVTDDQNAIAAQLAGHYANIPPELANWITQTIIQERSSDSLGVRPGTAGGKSGRDFQRRWMVKLERLQRLFASDNVAGI